MPNMSDKNRVVKILNYPPGSGLDPGGTSQQQALQKAAEAGANAAATSQKSAKKEEDKSS